MEAGVEVMTDTAVEILKGDVTVVCVDGGDKQLDSGTILIGETYG